MDVSAYRGCGSARHMMPANAPKNSQPTMRSTPFDRPTLACLAGGPREWKNYSHMEILAMVLHNPYIRSSTTCSRSALQSLRSPSCLFDSFSMCIDLDLDPIDQPVWTPAARAALCPSQSGLPHTKKWPVSDRKKSPPGGDFLRRCFSQYKWVRPAMMALLPPRWMGAGAAAATRPPAQRTGFGAVHTACAQGARA